MISHAAQLQNWLVRNRIDIGPDIKWLFEVPDGRPARCATLRLVNQIESRFDDVISLSDAARALDWDRLREELNLLPRAELPGAGLSVQIQQVLPGSGFSDVQVRRAMRVWSDFLFLQEDQVRPLQVPAGWLAALDYLLQSLYFTHQYTQEEIGQRHSVSTSTVGLRFRALVDTLNIALFDHPARKRLLARRAIIVENGGMTEDEFNRRLLRGNLAGVPV